MKNINRYILVALLVLVGILSGCGQNGGGNGNSSKVITSFSFASPPATGTIDETNHTVTINVPFGTDVTALTPTIGISAGASISPASGVARNFSGPVTYTVTAADRSIQAYTVTVNLAANNAKAITAFNFLNGSVVGTIDESSHTITVTIPWGPSLTSLIPAITHTGASISPASGAAQDFRSPRTYTVTAADGSTQEYTVSVSQASLPLYHGVNDRVYALAVDFRDNLYVGGNFTAADTFAVNHIVRWEGSQWFCFDRVGLNGPAYALKTSSNGYLLYAGGNFTTAGFTTVSNIAKWDPVYESWFALGSGLNGRVLALAVDSADNLYAGGWFTMAGGVAARYIAKWDGTSWSALGSGFNGPVYALAFDSAGNLYAGGDFTTAGGVVAHYIAKWDGVSWSALGSGFNDSVYALAVDSAGNLYAGGNFTITGGGVTVNYMAKWNGSSWSALGSGFNGPVYALAIDSASNLYTGGNFTTASGVLVNHIAKWDGLSWSRLGLGFNGPVYALAIDSLGIIYIGGQFSDSGTINNIAK